MSATAANRTGVFLLHRETNQYVPADLIEPLTEQEVQAAEVSWNPIMLSAINALQNAGVPSDQLPQHAHWSWQNKYARTKGLLAFQMFGLECAGEMQGLMLVQMAGTTCRIPSQVGKPLVYVYFVASAPWNSPRIVPNPRYGQVGRVLIATAISLSKDLGCKGRIGLHSLPQAETWYADNCGMTDLGADPDPKHQNLKYFEMTQTQATAFLA